MASREKKPTVGRKQGAASSASPLPLKDETVDSLTNPPATKVDDSQKPAPTKPASNKKPSAAPVKKKPALKKTFKIKPLKAKAKVKPKLGKVILSKPKSNVIVKKALIKNGITKAKVIRKKPQSKNEDDKPPVLQPICPIDASKPVPKKRPILKKSDPNYCSITATIESIIRQSTKPKRVRVVKKQIISTEESINESIEQVVNELTTLLKDDEIKLEPVDVDQVEPPPLVKIEKTKKPPAPKKKFKNIENVLSKLDPSKCRVIDMLDLNVGKVKSNTVITRRHSIEKFPITIQDVKVQDVSLFTTIPRCISPKSKRPIKLRQSLDSRRSSPYTTRSDSPARTLRNGKQRKLKHMNLLDGLDTEYKKRKRLCSDYSGSERSASKLSGYESDSSFSDLASLHGAEHPENVDMTTKEMILKKELLETLENNPPDELTESYTELKRSLMDAADEKDENKIDTNSNLCADVKTAATTTVCVSNSEIPSVPAVGSFKVPEKSVLLGIMKQTFNDVVTITDDQKELEKRKTRSSAKKPVDTSPVPVSTSQFYGPKQDSKAENVEDIVKVDEVEKVEQVVVAMEVAACKPDVVVEEILQPNGNGDVDVEMEVSPSPLEIVESPESLVIKQQILQALGLQSLQAAEEAKLKKLVPKTTDNYTGTLKTVIKLNRLDKKKGRNSLKMTLQKKGRVASNGDDQVREDEDEYKIMKEGSSSWKAHHGGQSSDTAGAQRKSHYSNRSNMDGSSEHTSDGDTNATEEGPASLVIPEKASSFSIHPGRLCKDECSYCFGKFGLFDTPCHIAQIKSLERQNKILSAEKHLTQNSCICDACFRHVDRKANLASYANNKSIKRNSLVAPGPRHNHCHVLGCGLIASNILRRKWMMKMRQSVCKLINIDLDNPGLHSIPMCEEHYSLLEHLMVCAMCKRRLARNHIHYLGGESNDLSAALNELGIPVKLQDRPVVCKLCRYFASLILKNPEDRNDSSANFFIEYKKRLLHFHDVELMEDGKAEEPIPAPMKEKVDKEPAKKKKKKQNNLEPPVLEAQVDDSKEESNSRVPSSDSRDESPVDFLMDYNTMIQNVAIETASDDINKKCAISIKRITKSSDGLDKSKKLQMKSDIAVQRLGSNPSISVRQLFPGEEELQLTANIEFNNVKERTPEGWEKCTSTIQYDPDIKMLWNELQKPYGNQSSFLRHLILLEKYFRNGDLLMSPNASHHAVNYTESVQNRLRAYDNIATSVGHIQPLSMIPFNKSQQKSVPVVNTLIVQKSEPTQVMSVQAPIPQPPPLPSPPAMSIIPKLSTPTKIIPPGSPVPSPSFVAPSPSYVPPSSNSVPPNLSFVPPPIPAYVPPSIPAYVPPTPTFAVPSPAPITTSPSQPANIPIAIRPKVPPGLISLQPGTKIPVAPLVKVPQSQKIKFPITKNWRPNLIPIDPAKKPEKKPGLVQVISGGKPYHITLEDYKKMCAIKRTFDLRQKRLQEANKSMAANPNSILKTLQPRKGLIISKTSVSPIKTDSNSDQECENSLEKLEKLESKLIMPKIPKSLTVIPQTITKKTSRPSSPTKMKPAGKS